MKLSFIKKVTFVVGLGALLSFYQNCSQVQPRVMASTDPSYKASDVVIVTDNQGQVLPVETDSTVAIVDGDECKECKDDSAVGSIDPVAAIGEPVAMPGKKHVSNDSSIEKEHGRKCDGPIDTDEELSLFCGFDAKTIRNIIDIAQFKGQDVNLDLIKGKTLIFSSDENVTLKSLNIVDAVGRTILCGVKVDKLVIKKGRLEVKHSEIKEVGELKGVLIKDEHSIFPAGM